MNRSEFDLEAMAVPVHRVTLLVRDQEPNFEEYARDDDVLSVGVEANVGEYDPDTGTVTFTEAST